MDTTWTIISGGRMNNKQFNEHSSFTFSTAEVVESMLLKNASEKERFENKLKRQFAIRAVTLSAQGKFEIEYASNDIKYSRISEAVEFTLTIKDRITNSIAWYFFLLSPERSLTSTSMDEIIDILFRKLPIRCNRIDT